MSLDPSLVTSPRRRGLLGPLGLAVLVTQGACGAEDDVGSSPRVERLERGDPVVVRTLAGSAWSALTRLAAIVDEEVWGITRGDLDEPYIVRYRLVLDGDVHGSIERGS